MYTLFPTTHTKAVCALEMDQVFLLAKYNIVTLWSKNEKKKKKKKKKRKMKKNEDCTTFYLLIYSFKFG